MALKSLLIKSDKPETVRDQLDAFFAANDFNATQIIDVSTGGTDTWMSVLIIYDDGT